MTSIGMARKAPQRQIIQRGHVSHGVRFSLATMKVSLRLSSKGGVKKSCCVLAANINLLGHVVVL